MIEKMGDEDEEILTKDIQLILEVSLFGVTRKFRPPTYSLFSQPTKNAREFLKIFKCMIYGLESTSLYDILCKVQQTADNIEEQIITISDINQVIQNILFTLSR
ncbi:hypothetical protein CRE_31327 [Caenorhabditis remanei]|uniref:SPK domain-containing protein n=1 Tax=Caenorhabditis remanei TaxID=31234 RepID=E3MY70_CAERE|nr:hypothetical protein CRE_31327 [Caenorhabditis remanei]